MDKDRTAKEEDLANLWGEKQERQRRDSGPGALDCVFSCAMACRLRVPKEIYKNNGNNKYSKYSDVNSTPEPRWNPRTHQVRCYKYT